MSTLSPLSTENIPIKYLLNKKKTTKKTLEMKENT